MRRRYRAKPRKDRKMFSRTAAKVHPKNANASPMRGGFRL